MIHVTNYMNKKDVVITDEKQWIEKIFDKLSTDESGIMCYPLNAPKDTVMMFKLPHGYIEFNSDDVDYFSEAMYEEIKKHGEELSKEHGEQEMLTIKEMAKYLRIGINAAYILARQPGFPVIKLSPKRIRIPVETLDKWIQDNAGDASLDGITFTRIQTPERSELYAQNT